MPTGLDLWPPDRPLSVEDLEGMEDDGLRHEVWDGVLLVTPQPTNWHQELSHQIRSALSSQLPADWLARQEPGIQFGTPTRVLGPDVIVVRASVWRAAKYAGPEDVAVVVEVESPSTRLYDRNTKRDRYAAAGIPIYVRVEVSKLKAPTVVVQELREGSYVELGRTEAGTGTVTIPHPVPIVVDAAALAAATEP